MGGYEAKETGLVRCAAPFVLKLRRPVAISGIFGTVTKPSAMRHFYAFFLFALLSTAMTAQSPDYAAALADYRSVDAPGFAAIVVKDGEVVYHDAAGMANVELGVPLQKDHVFRIGSITKQFTAVAILQLAEAGKLNLDDEITRFLPDYPTQGRKITVHHLLNHTSGIQPYTEMVAWTEGMRRNYMSPQDMIDFFGPAPLLFEPGEKYQYNNSGYFLLGYIIEKASGLTYENYVEQRLLKPLGMADSRYGHPNEITPRRVAGYDPTADNASFENAAYLSMSQPYAAGSLLSTVADLSTWYHALADGQLISKASLDKALTPTKLNDGSTEDYGYGLVLSDVKGSKSFGHGGGINGFLTSSVFLPEERVFVAVFSNCTCLSPENTLVRLAEMALGKYEERSVISVPAGQLKAYAGTYQLAPGFNLAINANGEQLTGQATGQSSFPLSAFKKHHFFNEVAGLEIRFNPADDGSVPSLTFFQGGRETEARRVDPNQKPAVKATVAVADATLKSYRGKYEIAPGFVLTITQDGDHLVAKATGQGPLPILPSSNVRFFNEVVGAEIEFEVKEDGSVPSLTLFQGGREMKAPRVE